MSMVSAEAERPTSGARTPLGWRLVSVVGELLITLGVVFLLLVAYDLWWTNVVANQAISQEREQLISSWDALEPVPPERDAVVTPPIPSEAFALMYIPRLKSDVWGTPLIAGVSTSDLTKGIGHFPGSALPGEVGNSSFAGHRATHGEPLRAIDKLQPGDMVYIETAGEWYGYRLTEDKIVLPTDVWVVDPVPGAPAGTVPTEQMLTLITCNPRWGSTQRWVWWGELAEVRPRTDGPPPEVAQLLRGA